MIFPWSLNDSKSPQVSRIFLWVRSDFNNTVVWMVSVRLPFSKSSCPLSKPLMVVPSAPFIIGFTVTFMIHNFFSFLARSKYLSIFSFS